MLQSLVEPETILAASGMIASNCAFDSDKQLSHTESVYSSNVRMNEMYNFPVISYSKLEGSQEIKPCPGF